MRYLLSFSLLFVAATVMAQAPPTTPPDQVVVTVNGDPVHANEVQLAAQQIGQAMARAGEQVDGTRVGQAAVQQVVDGILLVQEARRREVKIDQTEVAAARANAEKQYGGPEQLKKALLEQGYDMAYFDKMVGQSTLVNQLIADVSKGLEITDEQVATFYKENQEIIKVPEQVKASHILFKVAADASEADIEAAKTKAEGARKRALAGEDFAKLATELSEGPSAPGGGDLGFFARDRMVKPFADAAFALEIGGTSEVVLTQFGYHVIRVTDRKAGNMPPLDEVKDRIRQGLQQMESDKLVDALLVKLRAAAEIVPVAP